MRRLLAMLPIALAPAASCHCGEGDNANDDDTTEVGTFDGLFDDVAVGFNFPFDIAIVPADPPGDPEANDGVFAGDIVVASYGTSQIMLVRDPSGGGGLSAEPFYDGAEAGLRGATAVSAPPTGDVWAAFEQGGDGDAGGIVVLDPDGLRRVLLDNAVQAGAFARPGGLCWGGEIDDPARHLFFFVNMDDGTAWRVSVASTAGDDPVIERVGSGLATGRAGNPGSPGNELSSSNDLPEDGARGCVFHEGSLYVADAQNARVVRFDGVDTGVDVEGIALEDAPPELVTYPTDVAINNDGVLIVISYDNAHAFVALDTPSGAFVDNGLYDLNVNSGNYGTAVAADTIWFTRANNSNGALRAITEDPSVPPTTDGPFPPQ
jgi:hypothetical protein